MAAKPTRRSSRAVSHAAFVKVQMPLEACAQNVERLEREIQINIRRMGVMQAEIDALKSRLRG